MRIRTRVLGLLLVFYGITLHATAAPAGSTVVFTPEETARLDSLQALKHLLQERGDYEDAYRAGQAYDQLLNLLQSEALNHQRQHRFVLYFSTVCTFVVIAALCLLYLYSSRKHGRRLRAEKKRVDAILQQVERDNATQDEFLHRLSQDVSHSTHEISYHSFRIYGKRDATSLPEERAESQRIIHEQIGRLLHNLEETLDNCTHRAPRLMLLLFLLTSTLTAGALNMEPSMRPEPNRNEYCYREDGIAPYDLAAYNLALVRHEEEMDTFRRRILAVFTVMLIGFTTFLLVRIRNERRQIEDWHRQKKASEHAAALARESQYRKKNFLERVSHEVRTPLNIILGFTDILCDETLCAAMSAEELEDCRQRGRKGTEALCNLVRDSLELNSIETRRQSISPSFGNLRQLLQSAIDEYGIELQEGVALTAEWTHESPEHFVTDHALLLRACGLLVDNACKFTSEGSITLACRLADDRLQLSVTDTGPGIPAEHAERVFRHFEKLNEFVPGLGLGLSLTRAIARQLGGDVALDTTYTAGSRFVLTIPQAAC